MIYTPTDTDRAALAIRERMEAEHAADLTVTEPSARTLTDFMAVALGVRSAADLTDTEALHCPHCPDQGWYEEATGQPVFDGEDDFGYPVCVGYRVEAVQVQCEFCWTTPNSYFNKHRAHIADLTDTEEYRAAHTTTEWRYCHACGASHNHRLTERGWKCGNCEFTTAEEE